MLAGKTIVLGVTGGIAAYKAAEIVSRLKKAGALVYVIMTKSAAEFITPLTFRELSKNPVITSMFDEPSVFNVQHIALADKADLFLVAPATANIIGKIAGGIADDFLTTAVMATKAPVFISPAMNTNMYLNPIVQQNLTKLKSLGYNIIEPGEGMLACGVEGPGRLPEAAVIVDEILKFFAKKNDLTGKKIIVTAAGTREPIDPVRFIGNHSSGKMGYCLAARAAARGADVTLVSGPTSLTPPDNVKVINIETASEMRAAVLAEYEKSDIIIKAAAVADFRVNQISEHKIKKNDDVLILTLEKNPDILLELGKLKTRQILVGFAAESKDLIANATDKLTRKNLDMIVANDITLPGAGFNAETNIVKLIYKNDNIEELPKMPKIKLADLILDKILAIKR